MLAIIELARESGLQRLFIQPLGRDYPEDLLRILRHPHAIATFVRGNAAWGNTAGPVLPAQVKAGDQVPLTLIFEDRAGARQTVEVKAPVRALTAAMATALADAKVRGSDVLALALDTTGSTVIPVDAGLKPFDEKTQKQIRGKLREEIAQREMKRMVSELKRLAVIEYPGQ